MLYTFDGVALTPGVVVSEFTSTTNGNPQLGVQLDPATKVLLNREDFPDVKEGERLTEGYISWSKRNPDLGHINGKIYGPDHAGVFVLPREGCEIEYIYRHFGKHHFELRQSGNGYVAVLRLYGGNYDIAAPVVRYDAEKFRLHLASYLQGGVTVVELLEDEHAVENLLEHIWLPHQTLQSVDAALQRAREYKRYNLSAYLEGVYKRIAQGR